MTAPAFSLLDMLFACGIGFAVGGFVIMHFLKGDTCSVCDAAMNEEATP